MLTTRNAFCVAGLLVLGAAILLGCEKQNDAPPVEASSSDAWKQGLDPDVATALAELSDEDREAALEQRVCPVSGEELGSMGKPIKVSVEGGDVFVCCQGCVDAVQENPDEYLAKLKEE